MTLFALVRLPIEILAVRLFALLLPVVESMLWREFVIDCDSNVRVRVEIRNL
jgi:hypothetical protein